MIAAMLDLKDESILLIVIERDNLERIRNADPISLESKNRGGMMPVPKHPEAFSLLIAYEDDQVELYRRVREGSASDLLRWLERGRKFIPGVDGIGFTIKKGIIYGNPAADDPQNEGN